MALLALDDDDYVIASAVIERAAEIDGRRRGIDMTMT